MLENPELRKSLAETPNYKLKLDRPSLTGEDRGATTIAAETNREDFLSLLKNPKDCSRNSLLQGMFKNYSGTEYGANQWRKATGGWTTPKVPTIYGEFCNQFGQLSQLSLDAGFVSHLGEFMEMAKEEKIDQADYESARKKFKEKLGYKTAWRGMMLTEDELVNIRKNGIVSPGAGYVGESPYPKEEFELKILSANASDLIEKHFHGENLETPYISVSANEDVAISVGRHFGKKRGGRKFYLFKLKVPAIDLISYSEHGVRKPSKLQELRSPLSVSVDGKESEHEWDENVESYIFWKIDPDEIMEITQPNVKESSWNNRKTVGEL